MMICALLFSVITYANAQQGGGRGGMMMKPPFLLSKQKQ